MRFLNKKGEDGASGDWFVFILVFAFMIGLTVLAFIMILSNSVDYKTRSPVEIEEYLMANKFLSSQECFAYYDLNYGDYVPLSVDMKRFSENALDGCYPSKEKAVRLTLSIDVGDKIISSTSWNDNNGVQKRLQPVQVIVYDNGKILHGEMIIEVQKLRN